MFQFGPNVGRFARGEFPEEEERKRSMLAGLLGGGFDDPQTQGLLGMASAMLQASGPSRTPTSFGQALGQGLGAYTQGRGQAQQFQDVMNLKREKLGAPGSAPMSVQEWQYYNSLSPEDQVRYLEMKRSPTVLNFGDSLAALGPNRTTANLGRVNLKPGELPSVRAAQTTAVEGAKHAAELEHTRPKTESSLSSSESKTSMLGDLISEAKDMAGFFTTGIAGQSLKGIGGTPAHDLQEKLATIKANIGFDRLQEMRDSSKTGGALGQVSEMENKLLQSVWGSLSQSQSKGEFIRNLDRVEKQVNQSWARVREAYKKDYGTEYRGQQPSSKSGGIKFLGFEN